MNALFLVFAFVVGDELKSGPEVGKGIPGGFHPLTAHCPLWPRLVGKKHSFVEQYDDKPSVLVFARGMSAPTTNLIKNIDAQLAHNKARDVRCCIIWLSDDKDQAENLKLFAQKLALKRVDLAVDNIVGPKAYRIAMEAELTVLLCADRGVVATHAYRKGELNDQASQRLMSEIDDKLFARDQLMSGPQTGATIPGPFHPLIVHFPKDPAFVGKRMEFVEEGFGPRPVVLIFARGVSDSQTTLLKKLDATLAQNKEVRGLVVWLSSDDDELPEKLKGLAQKQSLKHLVLAIDKVAGPKGYNIAKEAELTIVLYDKRKVLANHSYRAGEFNVFSAPRVINDIDDKLVRRSK